MRTILAVAASLVVTFAAICAPAISVAQTYGPGGSWQTSCRYPSMNGSTFSAECSATNGGWRRSYVNLSSCPGGLVGNNNGQLFCEGGGYVGNLPGGSWRQSCNNARMGGETVHASCSTGQGYRATAFHMRNCPGWALGNNNGNLFCESGNTGYYGGYPGGSWQNSCRSPRINGNLFSAECTATSNGYRYSTIDLRGCSSRLIGNNNGTLFCERW